MSQKSSLIQDASFVSGVLTGDIAGIGFEQPVHAEALADFAEQRQQRDGEGADQQQLWDSRISNFLKILNAYSNIMDAAPFQLCWVEYRELADLSMASDEKPTSILHGNKMCASRANSGWCGGPAPCRSTDPWCRGLRPDEAAH